MAGNTGTYAVRGGRLAKISEAVPSLRKPVYFPRRADSARGAHGAWFDHLGPRGTLVRDKDHKRALMKEHHVGEL